MPMLPRRERLICVTALAVVLALPAGSRPAAPPDGETLAQRARTDRYGDPLPPGARARLGTLRFRVSADMAFRFRFAPDGKLLALADGQHPVRLCDAATGKELRLIGRGERGGLDLGGFSPDGKALVTGG